MTSLAEYFKLGEYRGNFHPLAVSKYEEFINEIQREVPLDSITCDDVKAFLNELELWLYEDAIKSIQKWLAECQVDSSFVYSFPFSVEYRFKYLVRKVYQKKEVRRLQKEYEEKARQRAIREQKEEQTRQERAELEYSQFLKEVNDTIKRFKQGLAKGKRPKFAYPPWLVGYHPNLWCELTLPTMEKIEDWARPQIQERVPKALRDFVSWEVSWQVLTSPNAKYEVLGVPCVTWWFEVLVLVEVHLRLIEMKSTRKFQGYAYEIEVHADDLGSFYLGPVLGGEREGFSTPIALLSILAKGEMEGPGIEVTNHGSPFTKFAIQGFEEETVEVHDAFRRFIKDIAKEQLLAQALLAKGLIDQDTAKLTEEKAKLPLPQLVGAQASAWESTLDNSDVLAALDGMGFKKGESKNALDATELSPGMSLEEKVKAVLKNKGM